MSNPEVGEVFVKVRVDPSEFEGELTDVVESGAQDAQAALDAQIDASVKRITDLQAQAETAALKSLTAQAKGNEPLARAEEFASGLLNIQANIAQAQFAAEETLRSAAQETGIVREQLIATAEAYKIAAEIGRDQLRRSQEAGRIVDPSTVQQPGILAQLGDFARASGRTGGVGGLAAVGARLGVIGLAATAAFQAFGELQQSLRVTGDEAFSTEGRLRNLGAELLGGNIIGGIKALTATRPAELTSSLAARVEELTKKNDLYAVTEEKLLALRRRSREDVELYIGVLESLGAISDENADALLRITEQLYAQELAAQAAATAVNDVALAIERAGSAAAAFGERGTDFGRGVGGITREAQQPGAGIPTTTDVTATSQTQFAVQRSLVQRTPSLADDLALERKIADEIRERNENMKNIVEGRAARYRELVEQNTRVRKIEQQIAAEEEADAKERARLAKERAERARAAAEQAAQDAASARALSLENAIAAAALTKTKADDKKAFDAAIDYWRSLARNADTSLEREEAQAKVLALRQRRLDALSGKTEEGQGDIELLRIENRIAAAQLTQGIQDDKKFVKQLIAYWREQVAEAEGYAKEQARSRLIAARLQLQRLQRTQGDSVEVFVQELFQRAVDEFNRFGSNIASSANGILAPQDARGAFAGMIGGRFGFNAEVDRIGQSQLNETRVQTGILRSIQINTQPAPKKAPLAPEESRTMADIGSNIVRGQ